MLLLLWSVVVLIAIWLYCKEIYSRFERSEVKYLRPIAPFGNFARIVFRMEHFVDMAEKMYNAFPEERFYGAYEFFNPVIIVKDLDLIKKIAVKDFEHFLDHRALIDEQVEPLFGRNLFALKGQKWKDMRSTMSPAFTSSKIKLMVPFMVEVGDQMIRSLEIKLKQSKVDYIDVDAKDLLTRYANDVIASCAFGLKVDSHADADNEFYKMGKAASTFGFVQLLIFILYSGFPNFMKKLRVPIFSQKHNTFFKSLVLDTMKNRETHNINRNDMINLLMEAKKGKLSYDEKLSQDLDAGFATVQESDVGKKQINRVWTDEDLIAQAVLFFIAGFETVSTTMSFLLYELAINPDVQDKLVQEIRDTDEKNNGKITFNSIQNMDYMDMVVSEVLRLWSPAVFTDRMCVKDYNLGKPNDKATKDYIIHKGEGMNIPVWAIHRSPEYFPEPEKFDPERFSDENKHNIKPFSYLPFGLGPRNCIGSRFALCEVKMMIYQLLMHMEVMPSDKTPIPAKLSLDSFNLKIKGGHWIRMRSRVQS